jgi:hypothetical protein
MKRPVIDRDLHRLMRCLGGRGARLVKEEDGFRAYGGDGRGQGHGRSFLVERAVVETALARELILRSGDDAFVIGNVGRAFLRRLLAGDDGFGAQHQTRAVEEILDEDGKSRPITVNLDESPLVALRHRKGRDGRPLIGAAEFAAGERFRADYSRAQIMPRVTANWSASVATSRRGGGPGGMAELTAAAIDARRRVDRAAAAVGPELAGTLIDFCCFLMGIEEIERSRQWPARSAKLVLRLALAALARHYGLSPSATGGEGGTIRHWGTSDYRPTVE